MYYSLSWILLVILSFVVLIFLLVYFSYAISDLLIDFIIWAILFTIALFNYLFWFILIVSGTFFLYLSVNIGLSGACNQYNTAWNDFRRATFSRLWDSIHFDIYFIFYTFIWNKCLSFHTWDNFWNSTFNWFLAYPSESAYLFAPVFIFILFIVGVDNFIIFMFSTLSLTLLLIVVLGNNNPMSWMGGWEDNSKGSNNTWNIIAWVFIAIFIQISYFYLISWVITLLLNVWVYLNWFWYLIS